MWFCVVPTLLKVVVMPHTTHIKKSNGKTKKRKMNPSWNSNIHFYILFWSKPIRALCLLIVGLEVRLGVVMNRWIQGRPFKLQIREENWNSWKFEDWKIPTCFFVWMTFPYFEIWARITILHQYLYMILVFQCILLNDGAKPKLLLRSVIFYR